MVIKPFVVLLKLLYKATMFPSSYPELRQISDASRQALSSWAELDAEVGVSKGVPERAFDVAEHDFSLSAGEAAANAMLVDGEGRSALRVVHRFVAFNAEWIAQQADKQVGKYSWQLGPEE
jgi:hypothetical protein